MLVSVNAIIIIIHSAAPVVSNNSVGHQLQSGLRWSHLDPRRKDGFHLPCPAELLAPLVVVVVVVGGGGGGGLKRRVMDATERVVIPRVIVVVVISDVCEGSSKWVEAQRRNSRGFMRVGWVT